MVGMITNISDHKDTPFLSIDKALSNKIKFSLLNHRKTNSIGWHEQTFVYKRIK